MNTYDFDQTIFNPDSSFAFVLYCYRKYPGATWRTFPKTVLKALQRAAKRIEMKELKEQIFSFLRYLPDPDEAVKDFWSAKRHRLERWYLEQRRDDDIIISASPEFLLAPICRELGVRLLATPMDKRTGEIRGENCHDTEKVRRFREAFPTAHTECFYSDSLTDTPMARIADKAYIVSGDKLSPWPFKEN